MSMLIPQPGKEKDRETRALLVIPLFFIKIWSNQRCPDWTLDRRNEDDMTTYSKSIPVEL